MIAHPNQHVKNKFALLLTPVVLLSIVGCKPDGGNTSSATTPPTSQVTPPTSSVTPPTSELPPSTPGGGDQEDYYNPDSNLYKIPKDLALMHTNFTSATDNQVVGFVAKALRKQQYADSPKANIFFGNGKYGFRANNVESPESIEIGKVYLVIGNAYDNVTKSYPSLKNALEIKELADVAVEVPDADLADFVPEERMGSFVKFTDADVTAVDGSSVTISYKNASYSLKFKTNTTAGAEIAAVVADLVVEKSKLSGTVYLTDNSTHSILDAADLLPSVLVKEDHYLGLARGENSGGAGLTVTVDKGTVSIGGDGETFAVDDEGENSIVFDLSLPAALTSWSGVKIAIDSGAPEEVGTGTTAVKKTFVFGTENKTHTIAVQYNKAWINDYQITLTVKDGTTFAQPEAPLAGQLSAATTIQSDLAVTTANQTATLSGNSESVKIKFTTYAEAAAMSIVGLTAERGYWVVLKLTAPEGYESQNTVITTGGVNHQWSELTTADTDARYIAFKTTADKASYEISAKWKKGMKNQVITVEIGAALDLDVETPLETLLGAIAGDPNSDLGGKPTGSIDTDHPITTSVTNNKITFGGTGEQIAYYKADPAKGRTAGNRIGVQIDAPAEIDLSLTKVTIKRNGQVHNGLSGKSWNEVKDGDRFMWWYPEITADMLSAEEDKVVSTVEIQWTPDSELQVFEIAVKTGTTLQDAPEETEWHYNISEDFEYNANAGGSPISSIDASAFTAATEGTNIITSVTDLSTVYTNTKSGWEKGRPIKFGTGSINGNLTFHLDRKVNSVTVRWMAWSKVDTDLLINSVEFKDSTKGAGSGKYYVDITASIASSDVISLSNVGHKRGFLLGITFNIAPQA